jgi:hypothetical protein
VTPCAIQLPRAIQPTAARSVRPLTARRSLPLEWKPKLLTAMAEAPRLCSVTLSAAVC